MSYWDSRYVVNADICGICKLSLLIMIIGSLWCVCVHASECALRVYMHAFVCACVCVHVCTWSVCVCVCVCVCMCVCVKG